LPAGGGALLPASGKQAEVVIASSAPRRVHLKSGSLRDAELGALEPGETILASLGGLRTLRARGDEIRAVDPGRVVCRLRLPGAGIPITAAEILEGAAVAIARSREENLVIDVVRLPGGRVHHLELDGALRVAFAPARGLAVASSTSEIVAVDLRYGRVTHRIEAPLANCHVDIDDRGETVALAATPAGSDRLSVFLVPFAELFTGAQLRFPKPGPTLKSPRPEASGPRLVPAPYEPAKEPEPVALPAGPLRALMLPAPPRPATAPSGAHPYVDPREHLGELLELARVLAARAIARAWDRGALAAPNPGARPGELELRALAGEGDGDARAEIERWTARARALEDEISAPRAPRLRSLPLRLDRASEIGGRESGAALDDLLVGIDGRVRLLRARPLGAITVPLHVDGLTPNKGRFHIVRNDTGTIWVERNSRSAPTELGSKWLSELAGETGKPSDEAVLRGARLLIDQQMAELVLPDDIEAIQ
jgi:hypothetical protein